MDYHEDDEKFKELLNQEYNWPSEYIFKFIIKSGDGNKITNLFTDAVEINHKPSSGGKYISYTIRCTMPNAEAILAIYTKASSIPGIISL